MWGFFKKKLSLKAKEKCLSFLSERMFRLVLWMKVLGLVFFLITALGTYLFALNIFLWVCSFCFKILPFSIKIFFFKLSHISWAFLHSGIYFHFAILLLGCHLLPDAQVSKC